MFEIKLIINGEEKTFTQPFVSGRILRNTIEHDEKLQENANQEPFDRTKDLDLCAEYVSLVFNDQFTADQFIDGLPSHKVYDEYWRVKGLVQQGRADAFKGFMNDPGEEPDPNA